MDKDAQYQVPPRLLAMNESYNELDKETPGGIFYHMRMNSYAVADSLMDRHNPQSKCAHCSGMYDFSKLGQCPGCGSRMLATPPLKHYSPFSA